MSLYTDSSLATVSVLQGAMHSRREPKYVKYESLVSFLYPFKDSGSSHVTGYIPRNAGGTTPPVESAAVTAVLDFVLRDTLIDYQHEDTDLYNVVGDFDIDLTVEVVNPEIEYEHSDADLYNVSGDFDLGLDIQEITQVSQEFDYEGYTVQGDFLLDLTVE